ncbi:MAG: hypothetical protein JO359_06425 [Candidatus Eremiobacteraeota bacterium]|nr:hypothetical protein [Candidatus Eremiobacteraeota bacterium]
MLNTIASLLTVTIVATTALAALVQMRHLRAGNQINAVLTIGEKLGSRQFSDALTLVNSRMEELLADPAFRDHEIARFRQAPPPVASESHLEMHRAAIFVGNTLDEIGLLIKNRIVDPRLMVDQYCAIAIGAWKRLESYTALGRDASSAETWDNFEYFAVLSEDWLRRYPSTYPRGVRRMELHNPWSIAERGERGVVA